MGDLQQLFERVVSDLRGWAHSTEPGTLCNKILLFPIAYKSYQSMAKMKALKPDLDKLKAKHGDDQQAYGAAQMGLYRQAGVSPLSGCLPQLLHVFVFLFILLFINKEIRLNIIQ